MKNREAFFMGKEILEGAGIDDSLLDARYLLEYVTGMSRATYLMEQNQEMPTELFEKYKALIEKRANHIPLAHLTGSQDFMGLTFKVNENVLIPRQDTETLVEQALRHIPEGGRILDLCTGSGCVFISILHHGNSLTGQAVDISEKALEVAKENAAAILEKTNGMTVGNAKLALKSSTYTFLQGDLFEPVDGYFDCIVSNPPYIPTQVIETLSPEVRLHDPFIALDGSADGLVFYRRICQKASSYLKPKGWLLVEIGYDQGEDVRRLFEEAGFMDVDVIKDYCGNDRVVKGHL